MTASKIEDQRLINLVLDGHQEAYAELIFRYQDRIRNLCRLMLNNQADGDDAAQDTFIKAYKKLRQYQGESSFIAWLSSIARNRCLDVMRSRKVRAAESLDVLVEAGSTDSYLQTSASQEEYQNKQLVGILLSRLAPQYREVIILRELQDLSYEEMALSLNCSLDAVKSRLKVARDKIGEVFLELSDEEKRLVIKKTNI